MTSSFRSFTISLASTLTIAAACGSTALADAPLWEDHSVGDTFSTWDSTLADGVLVEFSPVRYPDGSSHSNHAEVRGVDAPCNSGNRMQLVVMTANFEFNASIGNVTNPRFKTKHDGGIINLSINSSGPAFAGNWMDYNGTTIDGVVVHVLSGGFSGDCTEIMLEGLVKRCAIGLEEGWVDAPEPCEVPTYDDLALGTSYFTGDTFSTNGIPCKVEPFLLPDGSMYPGSVEVGLADLSCGIDQEIESGTAVVMHDFSGLGGVIDVSFRASELGGGVNLFINGAGRWAPNWIDLDGSVIGGASVAITKGGLEGECTEVEISGTVYDLGIGGQEHAHDCLEWTELPGGGNGQDECRTYDDMIPEPGAIYHASDSFYTDGILCKVRPQQFLDGSEYTAGSAFAQASMLACGSGQELASYACAVDHRFADSIGPLEEVRITVADHGGQINFEINGDFQMPGQYLDLDGAVVGGVTVTVLSGGRTGECTDLLLEGTLENLLVGGGQHFTDCLVGHLVENETEDGDFNNDGVIDGMDLAVLLGAWNTADGDLDGNGTTDGADLALLLGNWG